MPRSGRSWRQLRARWPWCLGVNAPGWITRNCSSVTVSYTHLDVYKRQVQGRQARSDAEGQRSRGAGAPAVSSFPLPRCSGRRAWFSFSPLRGKSRLVFLLPAKRGGVLAFLLPAALGEGAQRADEGAFREKRPSPGFATLSPRCGEREDKNPRHVVVRGKNKKPAQCAGFLWAESKSCLLYTSRCV